MKNSLSKLGRFSLGKNCEQVASYLRSISAIASFTAMSAMAVVACKNEEKQNVQPSLIPPQSSVEPCDIEFVDQLRLVELRAYANQVDEAKEKLNTDQYKCVDLSDPFNEDKWVFWIAHSDLFGKISFKQIKFSSIEEVEDDEDHLAMAEMKVEEDGRFRVLRDGPSNGVNTSFRITVPKGHKVLANKRPVKMAENKEDVYLREVVYTPINHNINNQLLQYSGMRYLRDVFAQVEAQMAESPSQSLEGRKMGDTVREDLWLTLAVIEHLEPHLVNEQNTDQHVARVLSSIASNPWKAYNYAVSGMAARGLFQFTSLYDGLKNNKDEKPFFAKHLPHDFVKAQENHLEAGKSAYALIDHDTKNLIGNQPEIKKIMQERPDLFDELLAASYNHGNSNPKKSMIKALESDDYSKIGPDWYKLIDSSITEQKVASETRRYIELYRLVRPLVSKIKQSKFVECSDNFVRFGYVPKDEYIIKVKQNEPEKVVEAKVNSKTRTGSENSPVEISFIPQEILCRNPQSSRDCNHAHITMKGLKLGEIKITSGYMEKDGAHSRKTCGKYPAIYCVNEDCLERKLDTNDCEGRIRMNIGIDYKVKDGKIRAWYGGKIYQLTDGFNKSIGIASYGKRVIIKTNVFYIFRGQKYRVYQAYSHAAKWSFDEDDCLNNKIDQFQVLGMMGGSGKKNKDSYPHHVDLRTFVKMKINGAIKEVEINPFDLDRQLKEGI